MTQNQKFYIEQILNYLNLLAEDEIFTMKEEETFQWKLTIECKNTAYRPELNQLINLLESMHPRCYDLPTKVTLS